MVEPEDSANAEKNPGLNAQENIFSRIGQLQANEIYQYMVKNHGTKGMIGTVNKGADQVNFAFSQAQTGLPLQKQLDEIKKEKAEIQNQNDVQKQGNGFGIN